MNTKDQIEAARQTRDSRREADRSQIRDKIMRIVNELDSIDGLRQISNPHRHDLEAAINRLRLVVYSLT